MKNWELLWMLTAILRFTQRAGATSSNECTITKAAAGYKTPDGRNWYRTYSVGQKVTAVGVTHATPHWIEVSDWGSWFVGFAESVGATYFIPGGHVGPECKEGLRVVEINKLKNDKIVEYDPAHPLSEDETGIPLEKPLKMDLDENAKQGEATNGQPGGNADGKPGANKEEHPGTNTNEKPGSNTNQKQGPAGQAPNKGNTGKETPKKQVDDRHGAILDYGSDGELCA